MRSGRTSRCARRWIVVRDPPSRAPSVYDSGMADNSAASPAGSPAFEKLGLFYLGRRHDVATARTLDEPVLYDSRDLVTHAVCIGMTGSGKTGLVPRTDRGSGDRRRAGDCHRSERRSRQPAADFPGTERRPSSGRGSTKTTPGAPGSTPTRSRRRRRRAGPPVLQAWGQDARPHRAAARSRRSSPSSPRAAGPGGRSRSSAPSARPSAAERDDTELLAERASGTATSALVLAGVDAPPRSREHSLVAALLTDAWQRGAEPRSRLADPGGAVAAVRQGRRRRSRIVLPGQGALRAGDAAQRRARRAGIRGLARRRAARSRRRCSTTPTGGRACRCSRLPTSATPSACSSCRC